MMPRHPFQQPRRATISPTPAPGGIFRDVDALAGTDVFNVYAVDGKRLGRWEAAEDVTDEQLLDAFGDFLERRRLHLMPPAPPHHPR